MDKIAVVEQFKIYVEKQLKDLELAKEKGWISRTVVDNTCLRALGSLDLCQQLCKGCFEELEEIYDDFRGEALDILYEK